MVHDSSEGEAMSRKFLSYNPDNGLLTSTGFEDGKHVIKYQQKLEPYWDENARFRANRAHWKDGVKESFAHAAFVPDLVILDMKARFGVNFYDKDQRQRILELIEKEYPKCKTTDKRIA